jgi:hypothetical protein
MNTEVRIEAVLATDGPKEDITPITGLGQHIIHEYSFEKTHSIN